MKTLLTTLALALIMTCQAQTKAKGKIESTEPYYAHILHFGQDNTGEWIRWEPWEWLQEYDVKIEPGNRIRVMFISQCSGQVIARVNFTAGHAKEKINQDIALDGSEYNIGSEIDDSWDTAPK